MDDKYKKLGKNIGIITIGNFASKILSFFMMPVYTAVLSTADYGISDLISTSISLIYPILTISVSEGLVRFLLDKDDNRKQYVSICFYIWLVSLVIMFLLTPLMGNVVLDGKFLGFFFGLYAMNSMKSILLQYARGSERIFQYSISGIIESFIYLSLNIVSLVILNKGIEGVLTSSLVSLAVSNLYLVLSTKIYRELTNFRRINKQILIKLIKYSFPLIANSISWWLVMSSDKYILKFFMGNDAIGIYSASQRIPSLLITITALFMTAWQISSIDGFGSEETNRFYSSVYSKFNEMQIVAVAVLIVGNRIICSILLSKSFYQGWLYVPVLLLANIFYSNGAFLGSVYTAAKDTMGAFRTTCVGAIINIILNILLLPSLGIMGVCIATTVSYYVSMILRMYDSKRFCNIKFELTKNHISYILIILEIFFASMGEKNINVFSIAICILLVVVNKEGIVQMIKLVKRG